MDTTALTKKAATLLASHADETDASAMAAYLKTDMPLYGVRAPQVHTIVRLIASEHPPQDSVEYDRAVRALWRLPQREEKHVAIGYARAFGVFVTPDAFDLYSMMVVDGAWWDLVDPIAAYLVGGALDSHREVSTPLVRGWIDDGDLWPRRTSIICQLRNKDRTDTTLLSDACVANMGETDFFIRKAIGWALREFAKTDPDWVRAFVAEHRDAMSNLSIREATKHIGA